MKQRVSWPLLVFVLLAASSVSAEDVARYILPPGNYGGIPPTENSTDQLPLYSGLTPLRDEVSREDIDRYFLPEDFQPIAPAREEPTGRPGLTLIYDAYGIPHVYGRTRADVAFGAGWPAFAVSSTLAAECCASAANAWRLKLRSEHGVVVRAQERAGGREAVCACVAAE